MNNKPINLLQKNAQHAVFNSIYSVLLTCILSVNTTVAFAADDVLIRAEALIRQADYKAAYQLLEPLESDRAGDIHYDYLLGIAGVESDNVTRGAFALERVLALDPNHKDARAEMAKAHYLLGETDTSKAEFSTVLSLNPDAKTKSSIEKLLTAIDKKEGNTTTFGAYLDLGLGWDSNVSSAPSISSIGVPLFGGITFALGQNAQEQSDSFMNLAAGVSFRQPINKQLAAFGSVGGNKRINGSEKAFDNSALDFNAGLQLKLNKNSLSFAVQDNHFDLNDKSFRHAYGATAQWLYNINNYNQAGVYAQHTRLSYAGNDIRNASRNVIGINGAHVFQMDYTPVIFASIYGGKENARDSNFDLFSHDIVGLRAGSQLSFGNQWQLFSSFGIETRRHDENDVAFLVKREDNQYDATAGLRYVPARDWSIKPQFSYIKNDSNIGLNEFERSVLSINVRKDFSW